MSASRLWNGCVSADQLRKPATPRLLRSLDQPCTCLLSLKLGCVPLGGEVAHPSGKGASILPWASVSLQVVGKWGPAEPGAMGRHTGGLLASC